jgi:hypothetical protein
MTKRAFSTFDERVGWLLAHHQFLVGKLDKSKIVSAMKRDGLVSRKTYLHDIGLSEEIRQAKIHWFAAHNH